MQIKAEDASAGGRLGTREQTSLGLRCVSINGYGDNYHPQSSRACCVAQKIYGSKNLGS
jgi:hypothetical protein